MKRKRNNGEKNQQDTMPTNKQIILNALLHYAVATWAYLDPELNSI